MSIRQVYVVENEDWLAARSNISDEQAYDAIVRMYQTVSEVQYDAAIADLANAGLYEEVESDRG